MRKSPFSTPRGCGGAGSSGYGWKPNERRGNRGYESKDKLFDVYSSPANSTQNVSDDDFIPFNTPPDTSPGYYDVNKERNFFGGRGGRNRSFSGSPGFYNNNCSPRGHINSFSPYNKSRGHNRSFQRTSHRDVPISQYIDMQSCYEDPWKELIVKFDKLRKNEETSKQSENNALVCSDSPGNSSEAMGVEENSSSTEVEKSKDSND